jgi:hypothetical protein
MGYSVVIFVRTKEVPHAQESHIAHGAKTQFIADYLRDRLSMTELCELYGVSRKPAYNGIGTILHSGLPFDSPSASPSIPCRCDGRHYLARLPSRGEQRHFTFHRVT